MSIKHKLPQILFYAGAIIKVIVLFLICLPAGCLYRYGFFRQTPYRGITCTCCG